jgi:hypothetical protein
MVGQTVYFAITKGHGITITDRRLHGVGACTREHPKPAPKTGGKPLRVS